MGSIIPTRAVEAALEISLRQLGLWGKDLPSDLIEARRAQLTELLTAAAPYMLAEAWDQGELAGSAKKVLEDEYPQLGLTANPYRKEAS